MSLLDNTVGMHDDQVAEAWIRQHMGMITTIDQTRDYSFRKFGDVLPFYAKRDSHRIRVVDGVIYSQSALDTAGYTDDDYQKWQFQSQLTLNLPEGRLPDIRFVNWGNLYVYTDSEVLDMTGFPTHIYGCLHIIGPRLKRLINNPVKYIRQEGSLSPAWLRIDVNNLQELDLRGIKEIQQISINAVRLETIKADLDYIKKVGVGINTIENSPLFRGLDCQLHLKIHSVFREVGIRVGESRINEN